jgi:DNA helicase-2/ATP-dependent DNA helicase PcrA
MARPYESSLHDKRIDGLVWCNQRSVPYVPQHNTRQFYFADDRLIYSDKLSQFVVASNEASNGAVVKRIEERFDRIYIDEIQDMAGYDLEVIELLLKSKVRVTMVGDHRQATFVTNNSPKNSAFRGVKIIEKFEKWQEARLLTLTFETDTYRCNQAIADMADTLFPATAATTSCTTEITGHDGVFMLKAQDVDAYIQQYQPQVLLYDRRTKCGNYDIQARNFGECKGLTFDRVLIFPHGKAKSWLISGDYSHVQDSAAKLYVAITRARHSVAFVLDKSTAIPDHRLS